MQTTSYYSFILRCEEILLNHKMNAMWCGVCSLIGGGDSTHTKQTNPPQIAHQTLSGTSHRQTPNHINFQFYFVSPDHSRNADAAAAPWW